MEEFLGYTASAFGYGSHPRPPLSPKRRDEDDDDDQAIEAYSKSITPASPTSTVDIDVITCVSYQDLPGKYHREDMVFKGCPRAPSLDLGADDDTESMSYDSDDDDSLGEYSHDSLLGLQFLEIEDEGTEVEVLLSKKGENKETVPDQVALDNGAIRHVDLLENIFEAGVQTLSQLPATSLTECFFPETA